MKKQELQQVNRQRRHARVRAKISGTAERPRLSVFRSNKAMYAQIIDDKAGATLVSGDTQGMSKGTPSEKAFALGQELAKQAQAKKITSVVFDRGGYLYAGQVKSIAEGAREGGLQL